MKRLLLIIGLLLPLLCVSQQELTISLLVLSVDDKPIEHKKVYLCVSDTIMDVRLLREGRTSFIVVDSDVEKCKVVIRQDDGTISRVGLQALIGSTSSIILPSMKISVEKVSSILNSNNYKKDEIRKGTHFGVRRLDFYSYSKECQINRYGTLRWYFPTELLLNHDTSYYNYVSQWYNEERYYRVYGAYPKEGLIDSLKTVQFELRAECLAGWYSDKLIQLKEPILCNGYPRDVYRFTWSSNEVYYIYDPYCMRIELDDKGNAIMYCSYLHWDDCEEYVIFCDIVPLQKSEITELLSLLERINIDSVKPLLNNGGSNNIFEANIDGQYHVIFRGDGEDEGMEELREFLWKLTGLGENKIVHRRQRIE